MSWSPPNRGYTCDPVTGLPLESRFDPSALPPGSPPLFKIIGSQDGWTGQNFLVRDGASGQQMGFSGPQPPED